MTWREAESFIDCRENRRRGYWSPVVEILFILAALAFVAWVLR